MDRNITIRKGTYYREGLVMKIKVGGKRNVRFS